MQFVTNIAHILFIIKLNFIEIEKRGSHYQYQTFL